MPLTITAGCSPTDAIIAKKRVRDAVDTDCFRVPFARPRKPLSIVQINDILLNIKSLDPDEAKVWIRAHHSQSYTGSVPHSTRSKPPPPRKQQQQPQQQQQQQKQMQKQRGYNYARDVPSLLDLFWESEDVGICKTFSIRSIQELFIHLQPVTLEQQEKEEQEEQDPDTRRLLCHETLFDEATELLYCHETLF